MADNPVVATSAVGVSVAAEDIGGGVVVQRVKVVLGTVDVDGGNVGLTNPMPVTGTVKVIDGLSVTAAITGAVAVSGALYTTGVPSASSTGLIMAQKDGASVTIQQGASITWAAGATVAIVPGVSITWAAGATVAIVPGVSITGSVNIVSTAVIAGIVSASFPAVSGVIASSVMPTSIALGMPVWIVGGQTATGVPVQVSIAVSAALGTIITVLGLQVVTITGAQSIALISIVPAATQLATTGLPVWLAPTQTIGIVSTVGTLGTILSTIPVSVSHPAFSGVIASSVMATSVALGVPIWIVGGQTATGIPVKVTDFGTQVVTLATGGVVTLVGVAGVTNTGTQVVTLATAGVVTMVGIVPVTVSGVTAVASQIVSTGIPVWLAQTQTMTVAVIAGASMALTTNILATGQPGGTSTGIVAWIANPTTVTVTIAGTTTGTVSLYTILPLASQHGAGTTGLPVWLGVSQTVMVTIASVAPLASQMTVGTTGVAVWMGMSQSVIQRPTLQVPFMMAVTITSSIIPPTTLIFTYWTGITVVAAGTNSIVPAQNMRINQINVIAAVSNVAQFVRVGVIYSNATPTMIGANIGMPAQVQFVLTATTAYQVMGLFADIAAASTVAIGIDLGNTRCVIASIIVSGYLF